MRDAWTYGMKTSCFRSTLLRWVGAIELGTQPCYNGAATGHSSPVQAFRGHWRNRLTFADLIPDAEVFEGLSPDELRMIARLCSREVYGAGEQISTEGEEVTKLYVVEEGRVQFSIKTDKGNLVPVDTSSKGECFGWAALLGPPHVWASSARAIELTTVVTVDASGLRALCRSYPHIGFVVMSGIGRLIANRLAHTRHQVANLTDQRT